jgi:multidrug efflux pump subunit AcrB
LPAATIFVNLKGSARGDAVKDAFYQARKKVDDIRPTRLGDKVTEVGADIERTLKCIEQELPIGIELGRISDQAQVVNRSIHEFLEALAETIGIVLIVSFIALGGGAGFVVPLTIPLVLAATFFLLSLVGIDLHRVSLGALVIGLGLLVDDGMIAVEMTDRKLADGPNKLGKSFEARERVLSRVRETLACDFSNVRFKADRLFNGLPVGWAVQLCVTGPDRDEVRRLASEVGNVMRATPEVSNVRDAWLERYQA